MIIGSIFREFLFAYHRTGLPALRKIKPAPELR
jgi:hypothetical protein